MDEIMLALINSSQSLRSVPRDTNTMTSSYTNSFTNQINQPCGFQANRNHQPS